jgi:hypothetical protein
MLYPQPWFQHNLFPNCHKRVYNPPFRPPHAQHLRSQLHFHEFLLVPNLFFTVFVHLFMGIDFIILIILPIYSFIKMLALVRGTMSDLVSLHIKKQLPCAIGLLANVNGHKFKVVFYYKGSIYYCTTTMGVEAALGVLGSNTMTAHEIGSGV